MTTLQTDSLVDQYFHEIENSVGLSSEAEVAIAKQIKEGDEDALSDLVKANLRFVVSVAKQYQNLGLPLSDLINEGNLGLIVAAKLHLPPSRFGCGQDICGIRGVHFHISKRLDLKCMRGFVGLQLLSFCVFCIAVSSKLI